MTDRFLRVNETLIVALDTIQRIDITGTDDDPAVTVHFLSGSVDYTGDDAKVFIDLAGPPPKSAKKQDQPQAQEDWASSYQQPASEPVTYTPTATDGPA